jgi:hypothetical protein
VLCFVNLGVYRPFSPIWEVGRASKQMTGLLAAAGNRPSCSRSMLFWLCFRAWPSSTELSTLTWVELVLSLGSLKNTQKNSRKVTIISSYHLIMDFNLKTTSFFGRDIAVLCQGENGPCPLLAIANVLILKNRITISPDRSYISLDELTGLVANTLLEMGQSPEHIDAAFNILPKLAQGLDLNVMFNGVSCILPALTSYHVSHITYHTSHLTSHITHHISHLPMLQVNKFEFTEALSVFDALHIPLLHGWLCSPEEVRHTHICHMPYDVGGGRCGVLKYVLKPPMYTVFIY